MKNKSVLEYPVLVLNSGWTPVNVTIVREAIGIVYKGAADVIVHKDLYDNVSVNNFLAGKYELLDYDLWIEVSTSMSTELEEFIHSGRYKHFRPRVIRVADLKKTPSYYIKLSRRSVYDRDEGRCQYCGVHVDKKSFTIDHIYPKSKGGKTSWRNIVCSCRRCNSFKDDRTPKEAGMVLIRKPVKPGIGNFATIYKDEHEYWQDFMKGKE